jgi:hypothetical protein
MVFFAILTTVDRSPQAYKAHERLAEGNMLGKIVLAVHGP